ncbi:hypothetical protein EK904_013103 [Melospiza melodia maxima]|nr:hypothetical protein EK904_013103 [Melospiza melodia maxima]
MGSLAGVQVSSITWYLEPEVQRLSATIRHHLIADGEQDNYERVGIRDRGFISYAVGELLGVSSRVSLASLATFVTSLVFTKLMGKRNTFSKMP